MELVCSRNRSTQHNPPLTSNFRPCPVHVWCQGKKKCTLPALSVGLQLVAPVTRSDSQQTHTDQHKDSLHLHDAPTPHGVPKKRHQKKQHTL